MAMSPWLLASFLCLCLCLCVCLCLERSCPLTPPEGNDLLTGLVPELVGKFEDGTIEGGAVVVHKIDKPGFNDEPADLNKMAGAFAPFHDPVSRVMFGPLCFEAVTGGRYPAECFRGGPHLRFQ